MKLADSTFRARKFWSIPEPRCKGFADQYVTPIFIKIIHRTVTEVSTCRDIPILYDTYQNTQNLHVSVELICCRGTNFTTGFGPVARPALPEFS